MSSNPNIQIHGTVSPGFESVKTLFVKNFESGVENNAQCCVYVENEKVVDLWGTAIGDTAYNGDSLQNVFSSTKSVTAIAIASLVDRGLIKYSDKISHHWPEFAQNGKEDLTLEKVLRHEAGMAWFNHTLKAEDLLTENIKTNSIGKIIEEEPLRFPPADSGTTREYHAFTRGWILNEIFRRVEPDKRTVGEWVRTDVTNALDVDVHIGAKDEEMKRISDLGVWKKGYIFLQSMIPRVFGRKIEPNIFDFIAVGRMIGNALKTTERPKALDIFEEKDHEDMISFVSKFNTEVIRRGELPSVNGTCSARGLAKLGAFMANKGELNGVRLMSEETWHLMHGCLKKQQDPGMLNAISEFSQGGVNFFREYNDQPASSGGIKPVAYNREGYYGWLGFGGSVFQWHPELKISISYIPTLVEWYDFTNSKAANLQKEVVKCVMKLNDKQKEQGDE